MDVSFIVDNPETHRHPVIGAALRRLGAGHQVRLLDVANRVATDVIGQERSRPLADLYLLKSHSPQALALAGALERRGALVVNGSASTAACQDRTLMADGMNQAGLPWPHTRWFTSPHHLLALRQRSQPFPYLIKSRYSRRGDLVAIVRSIADLHRLAARWGDEPVTVQELVSSDGWDIKLWIMGDAVYAARRRTPLSSHPADNKDIPLPDVPAHWTDLARAIGRVFGLQLYGVDLLVTEEGPVAVDINAFPGFRGVPGAVDALVALVERLADERIEA